MMSIEMGCFAGDSIDISFREAIRIATILGCYVDFRFNDVHCVARPYGSAEKGVISYNSIINRKDIANKHIFC